MSVIRADCHTHSDFSHDGHDSFAQMAEAAVRNGLGILCVTDHADDCVFGDYAAKKLAVLGVPGSVLKPYCEKSGLYPAFLEAKERYSGRLELQLGVEISAPTHDPAKADEVAARWPFDFILGSIHNLRYLDDFTMMDYGDGSGFAELAGAYLDECLEMTERGGFDSLAHLGYYFRYMARDGVPAPEIGLMCQRDRLEQLMRRIIEKGVALELNSSGLRYGFPRLIPDEPVLALYREMGGELLTLGSDSHTASGVGKGLDHAREALVSMGFRYYTVYRERKPVMLPLIG